VYAQVTLEIGMLLLALVALVFVARGKGTLAAIETHWPAWATAVAALGAYAMIHVETRYIGSLFAIAWMALLCGMRLPRALPMGIVRGLTAAVVLNLALVTGWYALRDFRDNRDKTLLGDLEAGTALNALGIAPGSRVARINYVVADGWARLGRVSIVAEVQRSHVDAFWAATPDVQRSVLDALAAAGAQAAIAHVQPKYGPLPAGWTRLGSSEYAAHLLSPPGRA
jgi:hypothetical protein